jgi:hypothetical protein
MQELPKPLRQLVGSYKLLVESGQLPELAVQLILHGSCLDQHSHQCHQTASRQQVGQPVFAAPTCHKGHIFRGWTYITWPSPALPGLTYLKGTVARDCQPLVFYNIRPHMGP